MVAVHSFINKNHMQFRQQKGDRATSVCNNFHAKQAMPFFLNTCVLLSVGIIKTIFAFTSVSEDDVIIKIDYARKHR